MSGKAFPSPALLVSICALVLALTGSAVALQGKNTVKGNDIAPGAVKPPDLDVVKVDGDIGPFVTTSGPAVDLGGPTVTVTVPEAGLIAVYARATGQINGGGNNSVAQVHLYEPTLLPSAPRVLEFTGETPELRVSTPGPGEVDGTPTLTRGGWIVFPSDAGAGTYTFSLRYSQSGGGTAQFSNAGLWVGVLG